MKLFCRHKYKVIARLQYFLDGVEHHLSFLECEECFKRKYVCNSMAKPYALTDIADDWVKGEYDMETLSKILGHNML